MTGLLVIGATGQVARALRALRPEAVFLDRIQAGLDAPERLAAALAGHAPAAVINAAAYTQVDAAEKEEYLATQVNAHSQAALAEYAAGRGIPYVTYSTDYVFDGSGEKPWTETDMPAPLNAYGRSKLKGEHRVQGVQGRHLILRTSWVYDAVGRNFATTILRLAAERDELRVIDDQFGAPTYAPHLAAATLSMLENACRMHPFPSGIYHVAGSGVTTWHGFAVALIDDARRRGLPIKARRVMPIPASAYPLPAKRPTNSRLDCAKAQSMFGVRLPDWQEGARACMDVYYEDHRLPA